MRVRFWGTRGSVPKPGPATIQYGGNTSCVEVRADDGTLVVIDCGTGAHELARHLATQSGRSRERHDTGHLLVSHTHWDHIQGFPFFEPLFQQEGAWTVHAPGGRRHQTERALSGQMSWEHHPVVLQSLDAAPHFQDLREGSFQLGGIRVTTRYLNHPALTLGYRLEADGAVLVYAADHEPHAALSGGDRPGHGPLHAEDRRHVEFLRDADLVVHDAQYTLEDFPAKAGWGHTPVEHAVDYGLSANAARLALFHHDPVRDDAAVAQLEELARKRVDLAEGELDVFAAAEGLELELRGTRPAVEPAGLSGSQKVSGSALFRDGPRAAPTVLLLDADPETHELVETALEPDGARVMATRGEEEALRAIRGTRPDLVLLDTRGAQPAALDACRATRAALDTTPLLLLAHEVIRTPAVERAFGAGASDYLSGPLKASLLRSRVQSWLLRGGS